MKLVIQIPCLDEADTLPATLAELPTTIPGIDEIEIVVIDDGSADGTHRVARRLGADQVVRFPERRGLAAAFLAGLDEAVGRGADIVVNTDGDRQYRGQDIARLVRPVLNGEADLVIGAREMGATEFSGRKKALQRLGSRVIGGLSRCRVTDAASGFRAYSRDAALGIAIANGFSHTLETLLQARRLGWTVRDVPVRTNTSSRRSRLAGSTAEYLLRSARSLLPALAAHRPVWVLGLSAIAALTIMLAAAVLPTGGVAVATVAAVLAIVGAFGTLRTMAKADRQREERRARTMDIPLAPAPEEATPDDEQCPVAHAQAP